MNLKHPQALNGFLLSSMTSYPNAIGLPGWLIEVLREEYEQERGDGLAVGHAMLRSEYLREWSIKRMRVISSEERQGYLDPILLYIDQAGRRERDNFRIGELAAFQQLAPGEQAASLRFLAANQAPAGDGSAPEGWMRKRLADLRKNQPTQAYLYGAATAVDTFCLHLAFVRSFLLA